MNEDQHWIDVSHGCGGHRGEYDWKCSECGYVDWFAGYTNPNKEPKAQCPRCKEKNGHT